MNPTDKQRPELTPQELDLLVDGELDGAARRELLERVERQSDGWQRCAAAFLEAQAWKTEFQSLLRPAAEPLPAVPIARRRRWRHMPTMLAAAASFAVALGLGLLGRGLWTGGPDVATRPVAENPAPAALAVQSEHPQGNPAMSDNAWRMVTLKVPDAQHGGSRSIDLPAVEQKRLDENWLRSMPEPLSPELVQALQRTGHAVQQSRQLLPVPLEDGRRLVVPIDQVDVHFVGNKAYQ